MFFFSGDSVPVFILFGRKHSGDKLLAISRRKCGRRGEKEKGARERGRRKRKVGRLVL